MLSLLAFLWVRGVDDRQVAAEFVREAQGMAERLQRKIVRTVEIVDSIGGLYAASREVERTEFRAFISQALATHDEILSLKWAPRVTEAQRPAFEAAARAAGLASFRITERDAQGRLVLAGRRAEYFPVYYAEPLAGNELTLGFDIASGPVRRAALEQARDSGTTVTTEHITLLQMPEEVEGGFLVLSPIYRGGTDR
ncbi:MAG: CHASE domain-containing protein, partial [Gammaproteobacteria bacterium]|nr:CHASE domain-containing protein [Gammaproteobacteria bacterium]